METLEKLCAAWLKYKDDETHAISMRRYVEDDIKSLLEIQETLEGTKTSESESYAIKVVGRIDKKVDSAKLQDLAAENGLTSHLSSLFRWTPEVNAASWKSADESIRNALSGAITAKPGRPSIKIIVKE
jgi:hypothetical protein